MYTHQTRLGISQTGTDGRQTIVSVVDMLQDCTQFWMESEPVFADYLRQNNMIMILTFRQLDILKLASYGEKLTVQTSIYSCKSYFGYRNTALYGSNGTPYAHSWAQGAFFSLDTGRAVKLPDSIAAAVTYDDRLPMEYLSNKIRLPADTPFQALPPIPTTPFDADLNRHINNARYVQKACECLPDHAQYDRLRIEYKIPAQPGAALFPYLFRAASSACVRLCNEKEQPYCVIEFSKR